jgi:hypothetical protein
MYDINKAVKNLLKSNRLSLQYAKTLDVKLIAKYFVIWLSRLDLVVVIVLALSMIDSWFDIQSWQTKDYPIGICCFLSKHANIRNKII